MRIVADLHVHSKYARATSPQCDIPGLATGAKTKGIDVIATGDFTHPAYFAELRRDLAPAEDGTGLYLHNGVKFMLSTEISLIYTGKLGPKRMHHLVLAPSLDVASQINDALGKRGNLSSDGRPILGLSSPEFADVLLSISRDIMIIPAHAWTPWFSVFGSMSGVDTIEQAFEDRAKDIHAIETGLSSDPPMNWMVSSLDRFTLVSNSDAHSLQKLGREANVFELPEATYGSITGAIKTRKGFVKTYEFYPEEGKYHYDGHRDCKVLLSPWEAIEKHDICPVPGLKDKICEGKRVKGYVLLGAGGIAALSVTIALDFLRRDARTKYIEMLRHPNWLKVDIVHIIFITRVSSIRDPHSYSFISTQGSMRF